MREHALRAAATATLVLEGTGNLSVSVIVGQVRSTATDLLVGTGLDSDEAVDASAARWTRRSTRRAAEVALAAGSPGTRTSSGRRSSPARARRGSAGTGRRARGAA